MRTRTGYKQRHGKKLSEGERLAIRAWKDLKKLKPLEWMDRINSLPERAQGQIARMVWWDFWSDKTVSERWTEFDHWLQFDSREETDPVPKETLAECLKAVGYPDYRVKLRLMAF